MLRFNIGRTHPYSGAWHAAHTKVPSESNLLYLPLPDHNCKVRTTTLSEIWFSFRDVSETYREAQFLFDG